MLYQSIISHYKHCTLVLIPFKLSVFYPVPLCLCRLTFCKIGKEGCVALVSALRSNPSHIRELDLGGNEPEDSGVKLLSKLLEDQLCKLEKLQ